MISGKEIYAKSLGTKNLNDDAPAVGPDNVFSIASCTKLLTSICALQCVEKGLITLDEPVANVLPELDKLEIIGGTAEALSYTKPSEKVTLRQLLTHSSGVGYDALHPLLIAYRASRGEAQMTKTHTVAEAYNTPLVFEPGQGWEYGGSLDWTGVLVARLNSTTLEDYMQENILRPLGMTSTSFYLGKHPSMRERFVAVCNRGDDGGLMPLPGTIFPDPPVDENGGHGLYSSPTDYLKVLTDIIGDNPRTLKRETIENLMFTPQFSADSAAAKGLDAGRMVVSGMTAKLATGEINYGLGGLLHTENDVMKNTLAWGGYANWVWFANREKGFAGLYSSHMLPPAEPDSSKLEAAFIDEMFAKFG